MKSQEKNSLTDWIYIDYCKLLVTMSGNAGDMGISQEVLSFESSLDRSFISQLECGVKQPSLVTIFQLAKALQTTPSTILQQVEALYNQ
jgi:predicted transcriptional regulator